MGVPVVWTASEIIAALRGTIGDPIGPTVTRWTAADLDRAYNRAALQVCLDVDYALETVWTTTMLDGQREYTAPENFLKAQSVRYLAGTAVGRTDIRELQHLSFEEYRYWYLQNEADKSEPLAYYLWRKLGADPDSVQLPTSLYLHPTPNATAAAAQGGANNLEIFGYKYPDAMNSTANPNRTVELFPFMVEAAIMYAASIIFEDDGQGVDAARLLGRYEAQADKVRGMLAEVDRGDTSMILPKGSRRRRRFGVVGWAPW